MWLVSAKGKHRNKGKRSVARPRLLLRGQARGGANPTSFQNRRAHDTEDAVVGDGLQFNATKFNAGLQRQGDEVRFGVESDRLGEISDQ